VLEVFVNSKKEDSRSPITMNMDRESIMKNRMHVGLAWLWSACIICLDV